jgi:hypothetical protein
LLRSNGEDVNDEVAVQLEVHPQLRAVWDGAASADDVQALKDSLPPWPAKTNAREADKKSGVRNQLNYLFLVVRAPVTVGVFLRAYVDFLKTDAPVQGAAGVLEALRGAHQQRPVLLTNSGETTKFERPFAHWTSRGDRLLHQLLSVYDSACDSCGQARTSIGDVFVGGDDARDTAHKLLREGVFGEFLRTRQLPDEGQDTVAHFVVGSAAQTTGETLGDPAVMFSRLAAGPEGASSLLALRAAHTRVVDFAISALENHALRAHAKFDRASALRLSAKAAYSRWCSGNGESTVSSAGSSRSHCPARMHLRVRRRHSQPLHFVKSHTHTHTHTTQRSSSARRA